MRAHTCNTCPFICNADKITRPKRTTKITDHFTCIPANVMYCITCTICKRIYVGETGRRPGDCFHKHLRAVKEMTRTHPNQSPDILISVIIQSQHLTICGLSLHQGNTESHKNLEQKFIFQIGTLNPHGITQRFSVNLSFLVFHIAVFLPIA